VSRADDPPSYDEAYDESGTARPHYAELLAALDDPGATAAEVSRRLRARRVGFGSPPADITLDPVPRILTESEWAELQTGIAQRLLALEAFVADVYGDGRVFADGVLAREDVESSPHLYLGEQPLLPSVPSRLVTGDDDELDDLVVKPRGEMGGEGVVVWRDADDETRERVRREIAAEPGGWIGQQLIRLSVHPTVVDGRLEPRHVDLRPFALLSDAGVRVSRPAPHAWRWSAGPWS